MNARDKLDEFVELKGMDKNKPIGWSVAADFAEWYAYQVKNSFSDGEEPMEKVERVNRIANPIMGGKPYPGKTNKILFDKYGCYGIAGNFFIKEEYSDDIVQEIAEILSRYHSTINVYQMWYSKPIDKWRLCFGH